MDPRLQEMLDHHEIRQTLAQYCNACDRCDADRMASVYLEDSWDDHGQYKAPGREFARAITSEVLRTTEAISHLLGQSIINVNGDEAGAETYFIAVWRSRTEAGVDVCNQLGGRFVDTFRRDDGRWLIKRRVAVRDWSITLPVEQDFVGDTQGLTNGCRSKDDPSYAVLRLDGRLHAPPSAGQPT